MWAAAVSVVVGHWRSPRSPSSSLRWRDARIAHAGRGARRTSGRTAADPCGLGSYLDLVCLGVGGLVYWQAVTERVPGRARARRESRRSRSATSPCSRRCCSGSERRCSTWRLGTRTARRGRGLARRIARPVRWPTGSPAWSPPRCRASVRLLPRTRADGADGSFALSVAVFNTTYAAQSRVDAQLTNGADVTVTTTRPPGYRWTRLRRCEAAGRRRGRSRCSTGSPTSATTCRTCTGSIHRRSARRPRCPTRSSPTGTRLSDARRRSHRTPTACSSPRRRCTTSSSSRATR